MTAIVVPSAAAGAGAATAAQLSGGGGSSRHGLGLVFGSARTSARQALAAQGAVHTLDVLPASADLRRSGDLPAVGDQGLVGSCATWTIAHTIMGYYAAQQGESGAPYNALYLWEGQTGGADPDAGTTAVGDLTQAKTTGVDTDADYWQGWYGYQAAPTAAEKANAAEYRITGWTALWQGVTQPAGAKQQLLEQALAAGNPVAVDFDVPESFEDYAHLTGEPAETPTGQLLGGHMVTAVGYDTSGVVIRNQWGTTWGHGGDLKLSWAFVASAFQEAYTVTGVASPKDSGVTTADAPVVTALSTRTGSATGGTQVVLTGSNLGGATAVRFGAVAARTFRTAHPAIRSYPYVDGGATTLVVTAPAGVAGTVPVTVTSSGGTSAPSSATAFTYTGAAVAAAPVVTVLSPSSGPTYRATVTTVTGTGLAKATTVTVGGRAVPFTRVSDTTLQVSVPAGAAGAAPVVVTTPSGRSSGSVAFTRIAPSVPTITSTSLSAPARQATAVTITGTGLASATSATVGGRAVGGRIYSDARMVLDVPASPAGAYPVVVTTAGGRASATLVVG